MINYDSPCVSLCELDERGEYCVGCLRTQEEVFSWMTYSEDKRKQLTKEIAKRESK